MIADGPGLEIILAMNIHSQASADRRIHRTRYDRRPPAVFDNVLPKLFYRNAGLHRDDTAMRIPVQYAVHARRIEDDILRSDRCIAITSSGTAEGNAAI